jgi:uncharacterized membrane protein SpoIIM required for sporulation
MISVATEAAPPHHPRRLLAAQPPAALPAAASAQTVTLAALIASALSALVLLVALVTRVALASRARSWLHYTFPGVPHRIGAAVGIFANNSRELLGVLGLLLIAQLAARRPEGTPARAQLVVRTGGELLLAVAIAVNALVVGAAVGAYGDRMVRAMLPHGPVEVSAYAVALALYLNGRHRPLSGRQMAITIAASVALLAAAALLETFR